MTAYYNEIDPHAAQWLRNLIDAGAIAPGDVDERDIRDVLPTDLAGYRQCHFFAGIGVWSYALRLAGWPDNRPVWTGSCPCQSFSAAGGGTGFADERHLWPAWFHLVEPCHPPVIFSEQVSAAIRHGWLDLVQSDLEGVGYACGALVAPACGVGAPHMRERLFFVAHSESLRLHGWTDDEDGGRRECASGQRRETGKLGDAHEPGWKGWSVPERERVDVCCSGPSSDLVRPGPVNGFWRDADWIGCRGGKWRPVEPGSFPLVDGAAFRMGSGGPFEGKSRAKMLKGYGNAIVAPLAAEFIRAYDLACPVRLKE